MTIGLLYTPVEGEGDFVVDFEEYLNKFVAAQFTLEDTSMAERVLGCARTETTYWYDQSLLINEGDREPATHIRMSEHGQELMVYVRAREEIRGEFARLTAEMRTPDLVVPTVEAVSPFDRLYGGGRGGGGGGMTVDLTDDIMGRLRRDLRVGGGEWVSGDTNPCADVAEAVQRVWLDEAGPVPDEPETPAPWEEV